MKNRRLITAILSVCMIIPYSNVSANTVTASSTAISIEKEKHTEAKVNDINVKITKQTTDSSETIYTGPLSMYANGRLSFLDFSEVESWTYFDWNDPDNESLYIEPYNNSINNAANAVHADNYLLKSRGIENTDSISELDYEYFANEAAVPTIQTAVSAIDNESCIKDKNIISVFNDDEDEENILYNSYSNSSLLSETDFSFDADLLTSFNTITMPEASNGANEPKFSYNTFIEENVSEYSGELTLNFKDLVLDGKNGLDLRIGRTYQTSAASPGEETIMVLPDENGRLRNSAVVKRSNYLIDRYNLGMGWGFNFPSVQVETEYVPQTVDGTFYYEEETSLYYHSGNGEVYPVEFTSDPSDSNLKKYYKKDIQFNEKDYGFSNQAVTSYYSMTLSDKTKQYFAKDGRLIGIKDRFGNTITFEHIMSNTTNLVNDGTFKYDDDMWTVSSSNGEDDAYPVDDFGRNDSYSMYFHRQNSQAESYIISQPIQVKPLIDYNFSMSVFSPYASDVDIEIIGYDTAYRQCDTENLKISGYTSNTWHDFKGTFAMSSAVRYVRLKIKPKYSKNMYIDCVTVDEPKPLIDTITDSVGRTVKFTYEGDLSAGDGSSGKINLEVTSPDGLSSRTLEYNREVFEAATEYLGHSVSLPLWFLRSSNTEGSDGSSVRYGYTSGAPSNPDGTIAYPDLYIRYDGKTHISNDTRFHKPLLSIIEYKDRRKCYEYEPVRKHLGSRGYYDTLRITKKYDMYAYADSSNIVRFKGENDAVTYSYSGTYNGDSYDNETGYPLYAFDDETTLNEQWTQTRTGTSSDTSVFSNGRCIKRTIADGAASSISEYTYDSTFKNSVSEIKNTVSQNGAERETYTLYTYNDWGGIASATKEVDSDIKADSSLLEKYTVAYSYNADFHCLTEKRYYTNINSPEVSERYTYDNLGRMTESIDAVNKKTHYYYENASCPYAVTKTVMDDPMNFGNVMGGDSIKTTVYDDYGLYAVTVREAHDGGIAETSYTYDYITGDILKVVYPDNSSTEYQYYSDGKIKRIISPLTQYTNGTTFYTVETHTYYTNALCSYYNDERLLYSAEDIRIGRVLSSSPSQLGIFSIQANYYDAVGNLRLNYTADLTRKDENGNYLPILKKYFYDDYDRLTSIVDDEDNTVEYTYDGFDRITGITDSESNMYQYSYDNVQNIAEITFDGHSELTDRKILTQKYDLYGNIIERSVYPDNVNAVSENYTYDLNGNMLSYTNPNGEVTLYRYDKANRCTETVFPDGTKSTSSYSAFGQPAFEKIYSSDGSEKTMRTSYRNEKGDLSIKFYGIDGLLTNSKSYQSDAKGRTVSSNEGGNIRTAEYDETDHLNILTSGDYQIHRIYNWRGIISGTFVKDNTTVKSDRYGYDAMGRMSVKLQDNTYYTRYSYSPLNRLTQSTMPSGRTEAYTYTPNGNIDTITSEEKLYDYEYYDTGLVKSINYPNGLKTVYEYDNINRITGMTVSKGNTVIYTLSYTYDANGNILSETRNGQVTSYSYDCMDRLSSVTYSDGNTVSYEYDAVGNRTKETYSNGDVKDYLYNKYNQLAEIKLNGQTTDTYTYNTMGAVTSHNNKTFTYDEWDKMTGYSDGTETYTYEYDVNGIRTAKNDKTYVVDVNDNVIAEADADGEITDEILLGHKPLARKVNGVWYYYVYNAHGDVIAMTDGNGNVVNSYTYDAWGDIVSQTETVSNPIKYAGEYYDDELGMYYLRARYYDPKTGKFIQSDPIESGLNWYAYCENNPVNRIDSNGLESYILYTTGENSDFSKQAEWQKGYLESQGERVIMREVNDYDTFIYEWNMIGYDYDIAQSVNVNKIVIYCHGNDRTLILEDGSATKALSINGKNSAGYPIGNLSYLEYKYANELYILACNTGNLDPYFAGNANVASIMSQKISGVVYAYDGNVSFGRSPLRPWEPNIGLSSRLSTTQIGFNKIVSYYGKSGRSPKGKLTYYNGEYKAYGYYPNTRLQ